MHWLVQLYQTNSTHKKWSSVAPGEEEEDPIQICNETNIGCAVHAMIFEMSLSVCMHIAHCIVCTVHTQRERMKKMPLKY